MSFFASVPKAELHIHVGGAYTLDFLLEKASVEDKRALLEKRDEVSRGVDYKAVFGIFDIINRIVNTNELMEEGVSRICLEQRKDGVTRLELRSGLKARNGQDEEDYLKALLRGIENANLCATVVLSITRNSPVEFVEKTCNLALKYRHKGVVGIDISGDSTKGDIRPHIQTLKKVRQAGMMLTAHLGESNVESDQMLILQELRPHRVGHGVRLVSEAVDYIRRNKIPVEVCPSSAILCNMHSPKEVHPWVLEHQKSGHPIIIGSDDPAVFCKSLTQEYLSLEPVLGIDGLHALAKLSHTYAFRALPEGYLPYEEFSSKFLLAETTTEKSHHHTKNLSAVMAQDPIKGMELLLDVDEGVIKGYNSFLPTIFELSSQLASNLQKGGRVFFVGSGSSGRVGVDIAARCRKAFPIMQDLIIGIISGGDSAMIRPKEGFEDSYENGYKVLESYNLQQHDMVFVVSASGSATFNEGCATYAKKCKAQSYYFFNSEVVPERTQKLFDIDVKPLCVDIGEQAIAGSTRLQAATLAECCLGSLITSSLYKAIGNEIAANDYPKRLQENMKTVLNQLRSRSILESLYGVAKYEHTLFSNPDSNFRRLTDAPGAPGTVTWIADEFMRVIKVDTTESAPTFSTNAPERESETSTKRSEFRAYMVGVDDNIAAWQALLGREVYDRDDVGAFIISAHADGLHSYKKRVTTNPDNLVVAVARGDNISDKLLQTLDESTGVKGLVLLCKGAFDAHEVSLLRDRYKHVIVLEHVPQDELGLAEAILLKQALNLISNTSMTLMNKIHGNLMIDVKASNQKLIGRCVRLVSECLKEERSYEEIYQTLTHVDVARKKVVARGEYVPSIVKITAEMYAQKLTPEDFDEVVAILRKNNERLSVKDSE